MKNLKTLGLILGIALMLLCFVSMIFDFPFYIYKIIGILVIIIAFIEVIAGIFGNDKQK